MKKTLLRLALAMGAALCFAGAANAAVDTIQSPTGFFVPNQASVYSSPYYRWHNQDWGWTHNPIGGTITTASLWISAWDVDASSGEVDNIYAQDNGTWTLLGSLNGLNDDWGYTTFNLGASFFDDIAAGLSVMIDIDSTHNSDTWAVTLAKSVVTTEGSTPPPPPVPEPATLLLLGSGLIGLAAARRKMQA